MKALGKVLRSKLNDLFSTLSSQTRAANQSAHNIMTYLISMEIHLFYLSLKSLCSQTFTDHYSSKYKPSELESRVRQVKRKYADGFWKKRLFALRKALRVRENLSAHLLFNQVNE